jgi:substrate import-associated zinc metallohydrolase lipoprotein
LFSCKKDTLTQVDVNELNPDNPLQNTALDQWLKTTFLDEYNTAVYYRYDRYKHQEDRNVTPPDPATVQPMMQIVLDGYVTPYRTIAGKNFIKQTIPKEWVLYGSTSYDAQGVGYAGTASGGVRVNLFGLNSITTPLTPSFVTGRLYVIHHEFTHILNQLVLMPTDFPLITKSTYNGNWTATPVDSAHKWGYMGNYASQNPIEDFAETNASLFVRGQGYFDWWVKTSTTAAGQSALRAKEASVANYYTAMLNVDYRALQKEIQLYLKNTVKDPTVGFPYWINQNTYAGMTTNLEDGAYTRYAVGTGYADAYNQFKAAILAYSATNKYHLDYVRLIITNNTTLTVRAAFTAAAGGTQFFADYNFSFATNSTTGETTFIKTAQGTGATYTNAALFLTSFTNTFQAYLTGKTFIADWLPADSPSDLFSKNGRFYQKDTPSEFFYGTLSIN